MLCNLSASHKRTTSALHSRRVVCSQPLLHRHFFTRNLAAFGLDMPLRRSLQRKFLENLDVIGTSRSLTTTPPPQKKKSLNRFVKKYVKSRMCLPSSGLSKTSRSSKLRRISDAGGVLTEPLADVRAGETLRELAVSWQHFWILILVFLKILDSTFD